MKETAAGPIARLPQRKSFISQHQTQLHSVQKDRGYAMSKLDKWT